MKRLVVLISGRGRNLQAIIEAIHSGELNAEVALVLSNKADAGGLDYARDAGIKTCVIRHADFPTREAFDAEMIAAIAPLQPDLVVLAGFMRILSNGFVRAFAGKLINIHPSLLPLYPGLHTHARAIAAGDAEHGASVHWVTEELDGGPVILQGRLAMLAGENAEELAARVLEEVEVKLYPQALKQLLSS
jgi:phosphoribosylglycinamide formyltransferase-1